MRAVFVRIVRSLGASVVHRPVFSNVRDERFQQLKLARDGLQLAVFLLARVVRVLIHQLLVPIRPDFDYLLPVSDCF